MNEQQAGPETGRGDTANRRPMQAAAAAVIILLLGTTVVLFMQNRKTSAAYAETKAAEETARTQYVEAFNAIAEIQDSLSAIAVGEGAVSMQPQSLSAEQRLTQPTRSQVMESIALLNASIQRTKTRIGDLESNLKANGVKIASLQHMVKRLKSSLAEKEEQVAQLSGQVDQLQTQVTGLQATVQSDQDTIVAKNQAIEEKRRELGTVYYVIGTKSELTKSGVIESKGGVLGLGKTVQLTGRFDSGLFTALDTDQETVIHAPAAKVRVISPQPITSYELRIEGNQVELHILDPAEFRKVKHVVIMTA